MNDETVDAVPAEAAHDIVRLALREGDRELYCVGGANVAPDPELVRTRLPIRDGVLPPCWDCRDGTLVPLENAPPMPHGQALICLQCGSFWHARRPPPMDAAHVVAIVSSIERMVQDIKDAHRQDDDREERRSTQMNALEQNVGETLRETQMLATSTAPQAEAATAAIETLMDELGPLKAALAEAAAHGPEAVKALEQLVRTHTADFHRYQELSRRRRRRLAIPAAIFAMTVVAPALVALGFWIGRL